MKLTLEQLKTIISSYVNPAKIGSTTFTISKDNLAGLVDKIGKIVTLDTSFYDKLSMFDGEDLPLGKTVEEWYQDLILPADYDESGENDLAPAYPTYRPATYSYTLGRKKIKTTLKFDTYERACNNNGEYAQLVTEVTKRLEDSEALARYNMKKQGLGIICDKAIATTNPSTTFATSTAYNVRTYLKDGTGKNAVVFDKIESSNSKSFDQLVSDGKLVLLDLVKEIALPTDTLTSEAFIKQVKSDIETASFSTQNNNFNGATLGAEEGLVLVLKKGVMPTLEVEALAGAFHEEKLGLPAEIVVVDDFGSNKDCFAILGDKRMMKLHNDYRATRETQNGEGDFINYVRHFEYTMFISNNTFLRVYKAQ